MIILDLRLLASGDASRGIGTAVKFWLCRIAYLVDSDVISINDLLYLIPNSEYQEYLPKGAKFCTVPVYKVGRLSRWLNLFVSHKLFYSLDFKKYISFSPDFFIPSLSQKRVMIIYDFNYLTVYSRDMKALFSDLLLRPDISFFRFLYLITLCFKSTYYSISQSTADHFFSIFKKQSSILYPFGFSSETLNMNIEMTPPLCGSCLNLVYIGGLNTNKNIPQLVDYIYRFNQDESNNSIITLFVCGPYSDKQISSVRRTNFDACSRFVKFLGFLDEPDLLSVVNSCHALIYPSYAEGFGLPLVEFLPFNKPILAYDLKVYREVVGELPLYYSSFDSFTSQIDHLLSMTESCKCILKTTSYLNLDSIDRQLISLFS